MTKGYVSALLETLADPEGGVREASAEALGTLFKFLGESKVMPFMPDLDNLKLEKIKVRVVAFIVSENIFLSKIIIPPTKYGPKPFPPPL